MPSGVSLIADSHEIRRPLPRPRRFASFLVSRYTTTCSGIDLIGSSSFMRLGESGRNQRVRPLSLCQSAFSNDWSFRSDSCARLRSAFET